MSSIYSIIYSKETGEMPFSQFQSPEEASLLGKTSSLAVNTLYDSDPTPPAAKRLKITAASGDAPEEKTNAIFQSEFPVSSQSPLQMSLPPRSSSTTSAEWAGFSDNEWNLIQNRMMQIFHNRVFQEYGALPEVQKERQACESLLYYYMHNRSVREAAKKFGVSPKSLWTAYNTLVKSGIFFAIGFVYFPHIGKAIQYRLENKATPSFTSDFAFTESHLTPLEKIASHKGLEKYISIRELLQIKPKKSERKRTHDLAPVEICSWSGFSNDEWNQIKPRITHILHHWGSKSLPPSKDRAICEAFLYYYMDSCSVGKAAKKFGLTHKTLTYYYNRLVKSGIIFAIGFTYFPHIGKALKYQLESRIPPLTRDFTFMECSLTSEEKMASRKGLENYLSVRDGLKTKPWSKKKKERFASSFLASETSPWTNFSDKEWNQIKSRIKQIFHGKWKNPLKIDRDRAICEAFLYYYTHDCSLKEATEKSDLSCKLLWNYYDRLVKSGIIFAIAFVYFPQIGNALQYRFDGHSAPLTVDFPFIERSLTPEEKVASRMGLEKYLSIRDRLKVKPYF